MACNDLRLCLKYKRKISLPTGYKASLTKKDHSNCCLRCQNRPIDKTSEFINGVYDLITSRDDIKSLSVKVNTIENGVADFYSACKPHQSPKNWLTLFNMLLLRCNACVFVFLKYTLVYL